MRKIKISYADITLLLLLISLKADTLTSKINGGLDLEEENKNIKDLKKTIRLSIPQVFEEEFFKVLDYTHLKPKYYLEKVYNLDSKDKEISLIKEEYELLTTLIKSNLFLVNKTTLGVSDIQYENLVTKITNSPED